MITRNLQNVSKTASNSQKYALQHIHKHNMMTVNHNLLTNNISSLSNSSSINTNSNSKSSVNSSIIQQTKYCFSSNKQSKPTIVPSTIADIIPSNINLSDKERQNLQQMLTHLQDTQQHHLLDIISENLNQPRQPLQPSMIDRLKKNEESMFHFVSIKIHIAAKKHQIYPTSQL